MRASSVRFGVLLLVFLGSCLAFPLSVFFVPWVRLAPPMVVNGLFFWPQYAIPNAWYVGDAYLGHWSVMAVAAGSWLALLLAAAWLTREWKLRYVALATLPAMWAVMRVMHGLLGLFGVTAFLDGL